MNEDVKLKYYEIENFASLKLTEGLPKPLYMLICKGDGCTQAELAARCQVKPSTLAILKKKG